MLLVDDDEPELRHRREHRRARADHDRRAARARGTPGLEPRAVRERGMQRDDRRPKGARGSARRAAASARSRGPAPARRAPVASTRSMRRRYTSVLPLPVTPCSRKAAKRPSESPTAATAWPWSAVSTGPGPAGACGRRRRPLRDGLDPAACRERPQRGRVTRGGDGRLRCAVLAEQRRRAPLAAAEARAACDCGAAGVRDLARRSPRATPRRPRAAFWAGRRTARRRAGGDSNRRPSAARRRSHRPRAATSRSPASPASVVRAATSLDSAWAATMPIARCRPKGTCTRSPGSRYRGRRGRQVVEAPPHRRVEDDLQDGHGGGQMSLVNQ